MSLYELRCPSCGRTRASSFVRVGAMVACEACGHRYRIAEAHVRRRGAAPEPQPAQRSDALKVGDGGESDARQRLDAEGNVIGLSGLSEMMRREAASSGPTAAGPTPPRRRRTPPQPPARRPVALGRGVMLGLAAAGVAVVFFGLGLALWNLLGGDTNAGPPPGLVDLPAAELPETHGSILARRHQPWHRGAENPEPDPEAQARAAELLSVGSLRFDRLADGTPVLRVVVDRLSEMPLPDATAELTLLDEAGQPLAYTSLALALLGPAAEQHLALALPPDLASRAADARARLAAEAPVEGAQSLDARFAGLRGQGRERAVRVRLHNDTPVHVERVAVLVVALDERGWPLASWRAKRREEIAPGAWTEFMVRTSAEHAPSPAQWRVEAAGR